MAMASGVGPSVGRYSVRPAVERSVFSCALDTLIVELAHRRGRQERIKRCRRHFAVVLVRAAQIDQHVTLRLVIADSLDEAAPRRVSAGERLQINRAPVFDVDRFCAKRRSDHRRNNNTDRSSTDPYLETASSKSLCADRSRRNSLKQSSWPLLPETQLVYRRRAVEISDIAELYCDIVSWHSARPARTG
jgi:hypothetical protein